MIRLARFLVFSVLFVGLIGTSAPAEAQSKVDGRQITMRGQPLEAVIDGKASGDLSNLTANNLPLLSSAPVGNAFPLAKSRLQASHTTTDGSVREYTAAFGMTSSAFAQPGLVADKVALYAGAVGETSTTSYAAHSDVWAGNLLAAGAPNSGLYNLRTLELDLDQRNVHYGDIPGAASITAGPISVALHVLGAGDHRSTAAVLVDSLGAAIWNRGLGVGPFNSVVQSSFFDYGAATNLLEVTGPHTYGLKVTGVIARNVLNGPLAVNKTTDPQSALDVHVAPNENFHVAGHYTLPDGFTISSSDDANATTKSIQVVASQVRVDAQTNFHLGADQNLLVRGPISAANGTSLTAANDSNDGVRALELIATLLRLNATVTLPQVAAGGSYATDAAAATGGVAVGQVYRNGSVLMIRVS